MRDLDDIAEPGSPERALVERLDPSRLPDHVAIIMDGNGRWANARHLPRVEGHRAGIRAVRQTVETIARLEIGTVTLYAFSTENWKRPRNEVVTLMGLLKQYLRSELNTMLDNNLRFVPIGRVDQLDPSVRKELERTVEATAHCTGSIIQIALNYSGRQEITSIVRRAATDARAGLVDPDAIDEAWISRHLFTANVPDPDLLIRTSGEQRISNFLLWQLAYSEIYFTSVLWPDFSKIELLNALLDYQRRERRFGGLSDEDQSLFTAPGDLSAGS